MWWVLSICHPEWKIQEGEGYRLPPEIKSCLITWKHTTSVEPALGRSVASMSRAVRQRHGQKRVGGKKEFWALHTVRKRSKIQQWREPMVFWRTFYMTQVEEPLQPKTPCLWESLPCWVSSVVSAWPLPCGNPFCLWDALKDSGSRWFPRYSIRCLWTFTSRRSSEENQYRRWPVLFVFSDSIS